MANWELTLKNVYLELMRHGKKDLEVRVGYNKIKKIKSGDTILFLSRDDEHEAAVKSVRSYPSFKEMLDKERPDGIVPGQSREQVEKTLKSIFPSNREALGVYVFELG